jgi:hypothetical protein
MLPNLARTCPRGTTATPRVEEPYPFVDVDRLLADCVRDFLRSSVTAVIASSPRVVIGADCTS